MNKIALTTLALGFSLAAPAAFAQQQPVQPGCPPGSWLCADITIGGGAPLAPPVVVAPAPPPPRVIVLPPRPQIYFTPPPPVRVYVAPPPVVMYQPPTYVQQPTYMAPPPRYYLPPPRPRSYVGIEASLGGSYLGTPMNSTSGSFMGGLNAGLRFRGAGHLGGELTVGVFGGHDYNGDSRTEVPVGFTGLFFFNPQNRFQIYGLLGVGGSFASVNYDPSNYGAHGGKTDGHYTYLGASAGLGAELQLSQRFSFFADVRGFVRGRVDGDTASNPEFSRTNASGTTQTTNTSGGALGQIGAVLYF